MKKPQLRVTKADAAWLMLATLAVVLQFWWLPGDGGNTADSFSSTLEGSRGLFETLSVLSEKGHLPQVRRETDRLVPEEPETLFLIAPDRYPDVYEQEKLREFVQSGGTVVLAANWSVPNPMMTDFQASPLRCQLTWKRSPSVTPPPTVTAGGPTTPTTVPSSVSPPTAAQASSTSENPKEELLAEAPDFDDKTIATESDPGEDQATPVEDDPLGVAEIGTINHLVDGEVTWRSSAYVSSAPRSAEHLVVDTDGDVQLAAWRLGRGTFIVCATADPFSNRSMLFPKQVEFAVRLVEFACERTSGGRQNTEIIISEYLNGAGSYTGASVMVSPLLRSGTLQLILIAILLAWSGFHRFGPPLRERRAWRRSLAESAQAVGNLQFMANDGATSVRQYFEWFCGEVHRRDGHTLILDDTGLLARQTGLDQEQVVEALANARLLSDKTQVGPAEAAAAIRQLARIHQRMFQASHST